VAAQHAVQAVVTVEQHREDRRAETVGPVRDERRRHDGTQLCEDSGRILDLEPAMGRLVIGTTLPAQRLLDLPAATSRRVVRLTNGKQAGQIN
jgi:hypothetical protein